MSWHLNVCTYIHVALLQGCLVARCQLKKAWSWIIVLFVMHIIVMPSCTFPRTGDAHKETTQTASDKLQVGALQGFMRYFVRLELGGGRGRLESTMLGII